MLSKNKEYVVDIVDIGQGGVGIGKYEGFTVFVEGGLIQDKVKVRINRIHIEEDAGKLVHLEDEPFSLIDYNRCGVPLIEIVTEPDLRSPAEAAEFMRQLKGILEYAEVSDCRME